MATFSEALRAAAQAATCQLLQPNENIAGLLRSVGLGNNPISTFGETFRRTLCSNPSPVNPTSDSPFQGGQCAGTVYFVEVVYFQNGQQYTYRDGAEGPIGAAEIIESNGAWIGRFRNRYGHVNFTSISQSFPKPNIISQGFYAPPQGPDNCGNLPGADLPAIPSVGGPVNITYNTNEGDEITEEGDIRIHAPIFSPIGILYFPITFDLGGLTIEGNLNLNGDFEFTGNLNIGTGSGGDGEPEDPPEPEARVIIGARVITTANTGVFATRITANDGPDVWIPRLGTISFLQPIGEGQAWCNDIPVKHENAWIPCPEPGRATKIAGTPSLGVSWLIRAIYDRPSDP